MRDPLCFFSGIKIINHFWWIHTSLSPNKWLWRRLKVVMYWGTAGWPSMGVWSWNPSMHWTNSVQLKLCLLWLSASPPKFYPFQSFASDKSHLIPTSLKPPEANVCSSRLVLWSAITVPCQVEWLQLALHTWSLNLPIDLPQSGIKCPIITCHKDFSLLSQCSTWLYQKLPQRALWREQVSLPSR